MNVARGFACLLVLLGWSVTPAHGFVYRTARGLYDDCAAGVDGHTTGAPQKYRHCIGYIHQIFNNWNLNQDNGICSRYYGDQLPRAYVDYWRAKGLGFLSGTFISAETSVNQFLDSQKQPCPVPDLKTNPP